jgi:starvation-inducible DNA-binding protein
MAMGLPYRKCVPAALSISMEQQLSERLMTTSTSDQAKMDNGIAAPALRTPTDLQPEATRDIAGALNAVLADVFVLYMKTKNFHWHMSGPHFRDYHLLLDDQATEIFAMTDVLAERIRKLGGKTLRSIGHISRLQRIADNDEEFVEPSRMLNELCADNRTLVASLRDAHEVCDENRDIATASLIENWIDETEERTWFLFEADRDPDRTGH